jgi:hypothetical protein
MDHSASLSTSPIRRLRRWAEVLTVSLITAFILCFSVWCLVAPKQTFSENENRALASWPVYSFDTLKDGSYMSGIQTYLSDHFPLRDPFMTLKTKYEMLTGREEINDIYLAKDGYYIEAYKTPKQQKKIITQFQKLQDAITTGAKENVRVMLVPTAISTYNAKLPNCAPDRGVLRQVDTMNEIYAALPNMQKVDAWSALQAAAAQEETDRTRASGDADGAQPVTNAGDAVCDTSAADGLYYHTDHHWTTHGAYVGYQAYCDAAGLSPIPEADFQKTCVTTDFHGTIFSKLHDSTVPGDAITLYENPANRLTVSYPDTGEVTDTLYNRDYLAQKDKYSMFLNNLHPLVEITNETADSDRQLVLIKDSYANSMVPFLVNHYQKIYVFDTRYYRFGPSSFINEHPEVTDVLLLYNMNTIDTDLGVGGIF